ncbi:MAG TPA: hypothetical protein VIM62_09265 [Acidobacteriaceae bacterium]
MSQTAARMVTLSPKPSKDLRLSRQPPEGLCVQNPSAVPRKWSSIRMPFLAVRTARQEFVSL